MSRDDWIHSDDLLSICAEKINEGLFEDEIKDQIIDGCFDDEIFTEVLESGRFDDALKEEGIIHLDEKESELLMRIFEEFAEPMSMIFYESSKDYRALILKFFEHFHPSTETARIRATLWAAAEDQVEAEKHAQ
jgi:hypothetical protein